MRSIFNSVGFSATVKSKARSWTLKVSVPACPLTVPMVAELSTSKLSVLSLGSAVLVKVGAAGNATKPVGCSAVPALACADVSADVLNVPNCKLV